MKNTLDWALKMPGSDLRRDVPMARMTSMRVGGPADWVLFPRDEGEIARALALAAEHRVPVTVMGNGSNLIVRDGGIRGLVIAIDSGMSRVSWEEGLLCAQAGASLKMVSAAALEAGRSGLEFASGIPGNVGGALFMNAGAYGGEIAQVVHSAAALMPDGSTRVFSREEMALGYRQSVFQENGGIILRARFSLETGDPQVIRARMADYGARRQEKQPLNLPSAGSAFRRPPGRFAAALIQEAGLKGARVGGAQVSEKHAGFIVNTGGATARDVLELIEEVKARVYRSSGVHLETEVRILGE